MSRHYRELTDSGVHNLAAAILLRAALDTEYCVTCRDREHRHCERGEYCHVMRFWASPWARLLCDEVGLRYVSVLRWAMRKEAAA